MTKRIITAIIGVPILIGLLVLGGYYVTLVSFVLAEVGIFEYVRAVNKILDHKISYFFVFIITAILILIMKFNYYATLPALLVCLMLVFCNEILGKKHDVIRGIATLFGFVYIPVMFGYLQLFDTIQDGIYYLCIIFIIAFCTDTFAYFIGMLFGKKKLAPEISPKKTVAGAIGGLVFGGIGMVVYAIILKNGFQITLPWISVVIVGLIGSFAGQCGDLTASMIKRDTGSKDYGKCLPGHGGILDRFDSILFVIPIVYIFAIYTFAYI